MRTLLTYGFYSLTVLFLMYEILKTGGFNAFRTLNELKEKSDLEKKANEELKISDPNAEPQTSATAGMFVFSCFYIVWITFYIVWGLVGLFTSQWMFFVILLSLSFLTAGLATAMKNYATAILRIDAFITIILLVAMIINRFHLHII